MTFRVNKRKAIQAAKQRETADKNACENKTKRVATIAHVHPSRAGLAGLFASVLLNRDEKDVLKDETP